MNNEISNNFTGFEELNLLSENDIKTYTNKIHSINKKMINFELKLQEEEKEPFKTYKNYLHKYQEFVVTNPYSKKVNHYIDKMGEIVSNNPSLTIYHILVEEKRACELMIGKKEPTKNNSNKKFNPFFEFFIQCFQPQV